MSVCTLFCGEKDFSFLLDNMKEKEKKIACLF